ncbi:MAG TPA: hypothetical protein PKN54_00730 [Candidatus Cloacimonas acidaminovorans]|nr:hypothetical protein [Candidatus Cloacimonas acidaminovorans]
MYKIGDKVRSNHICSEGEIGTIVGFYNGGYYIQGFTNGSIAKDKLSDKEKSSKFFDPSKEVYAYSQHLLNIYERCDYKKICLRNLL